MSIVHNYPEPKAEVKSEQRPFAPGVIDFGARRYRIAYKIARFVWSLMFWLLVSGSITFTFVLLAAWKGWI